MFCVSNKTGQLLQPTAKLVRVCLHHMYIVHLRSLRTGAISAVRGSLREQRGEGCEKLEEPVRPHVARDLGASIDRATIERPLDVVRRRVRWTPMSSAVLFGKTGRVGESWQPLRSEVRARRLECALQNVERLDGESSLVGPCA